MTDDMVSADAARELLEGSTPGPWCAGRSASGHLCIAQTADPGEDVAVALDAIFADAALMAAAPDLARTVVALHGRVAAVEAERDRLREREEHFARVLAVTDGGQYRADWDSAIRRVVSERDALRAITEGRTTPPTDGEALDILERGGSFRVVCNSESYECSTLSSVWAAADLPNAVWWAHNVYGRPCAWPGDEP